MIEILDEIKKLYDRESSDNLSSFEIIDPYTLRSNNGKFIKLNTAQSDILAELYNMKNMKFSNKLYELSSDLWIKLIQALSIDPEVMENVSDYQLVIKDNDALALYNKNNDFMLIVDEINKYIGKYHVYLYEVKNSIIFKILDETKSYGLVIRWYTTEDWITIYSLSVKDDNVEFVYPNPIISNKSDNDTIQSVFKIDELMELSKNDRDNLYKDLVDTYNEVNLSVGEVYYYIRSLTGLRLKKDMMSQEDEDSISVYGDKVVNLIKKVEDTLYKDDESLIRLDTNYLRKSIRLTSITLNDIANLESYLVESDSVPITVMLDLSYKLLKYKFDYYRLQGETLIKRN